MSSAPGLPARLRRELRALFGLTASTWILAVLAAPLMAATLAVLISIAPAAASAAEAPAPATAAVAPVDPAALAQAVASMEDLDRLRIGLAASLEGSEQEPTMETMREVCRPVGLRAGAIAREHGWQVRQVAAKYRNPDHAPASGQEQQVIELFERDRGITGLWEPASSAQGSGVNYYRRIDVQPSCMVCHGSRQSRPAFVKENYPQDRAFDFAPGDLRGMYAVSIPSAQQPAAG